VSVYLSLPILSVTHLDEITQVGVVPFTLGYLRFCRVGWTEVLVMSEPVSVCVPEVTVPRTNGASVLPTLTASANGASAILDVYWL